MVKVLFQTNNVNGPSTIFNHNMLQGLNIFKDFSVDFYNKNYQNYDVVLFMGYDPDTECAKQTNSKIKVGIIDPRPGFNINFTNVDFILANGIEMRDFYSKNSQLIFNYYIYPELKYTNDAKINQKVIIGYHGNKVHLEASRERILPAIELLSEKYQVELWLMYDINSLGKWKYTSSSKSLYVKHLQWTEDGYQNHMSRVDIGIVPSLIPVKKSFLANKKNNFLNKIFTFNKLNKSSDDFSLRFKVTSNAGRALVFAQLKVPVVMDMTPSALQLISDSDNGFVCHSMESWFNSLSRLAESRSLRLDMANKMYKEFELNYSPEKINKKFKDFLLGIV
jgi:glycosyltransferase involved in cell wall biosynthesis